ncbi:MAG: multidrug effflux MFS transporter [Deferribacterales bacterium]
MPRNEFINAKGSLRLLLILSLLMGFASLSTDVYLPAMPAMQQALGVSPGMIEFTVSGYLIGFSIGQLFWGPISDRYGRRKPVIIGLVLFIIGSAGCAMSGDIITMIAWRVVQALGACASVALSRAMVRDIYSGSEAARMMSVLISVMAIAPLVGPFIGGQVLLFSGWRMIFWGLVVLGALTLASMFTIQETLPAERRDTDTSIFSSILNYFKLIKHRSILAYAGASGFFYCSIFAYVAGSPFAYIDYHHLKPQYYGILFGINTLGIMLSNLLNNKVVTRFGLKKIIVFGGVCSTVAGIVLVLNALSDFGGLAGLAIPLFVLVSMNGFIVANSIAGALEDFPHNAGAVSALIGMIQYGSGIAGTGITGLLADGTPLPMAGVMGVSGVFILVFALLIPKRAD